MEKKILGLDLGTNSIGWALIYSNFENKGGNILGLGSRIIPMSQDILGDFDSGVSISQTAKRTEYRGTRRLYQRDNLRRERLHRVLNVLGFLPQHYANVIDFEKHFGQFKENEEVKINYKKEQDGKYQFIFMDSFLEMAKEFGESGQSTKIPLDWTIYYLRKKALSQKITKEELAWILLNFNQKRGYYQLRGDEMDEEEQDKTKKKEFLIQKVKEVQKTEDRNKDGTWYNVILENDWVYRRQSKEPLNWEGKTKEFIVTTDLEKDGTPKKNKDDSIKRSFKMVDSEKDWVAIKAKTEQGITQSGKTVGQYIYETLLENPKQKIRGKLVRTIERDFYKTELEKILKEQAKHHHELSSKEFYNNCIEELYPRNEGHKANIKGKGFLYLFLDDIIFYQRPLKIKKSTIGRCQYESHSFKNIKTGEIVKEGVKAISKSHPLFQEFRLWQFLHNLKIYQKGLEDTDVTDKLMPNDSDKVDMFDFLNNKKEVEQKDVIGYFAKKRGISLQEKKNYRWNYVEDKKYPANETRGQFISRLKKVDDLDIVSFLNSETETALWHIIYSVKDKKEYKKALETYAIKYNIHKDSFLENFLKFPPFVSSYGSYSQKAIKKLLPVMRMGKYWNKEDVFEGIKERVNAIMERVNNLNLKEISGKKLNEALLEVEDSDIPKQLIKSFVSFKDKNPLSGLNTYQACYLVYERHSEASEISQWKTPKDIDEYLDSLRQHSLRNPIVEQIVLETLRTVRDIWEYYGKGKPNFFNEIHIELGREMKNPADKRKQILDRNKENENTNQRIRKLLLELKNDNSIEGDIRPYSPSQQEKLKLYEEGVYQNTKDDYNKVNVIEINKIRGSASPTNEEISKYKLWLEQGYCSPYTGKVIPLSKLFTTDYEIEHIIPQARYFDNSLSNKVICESEVNKRKSSKTAYEFLKERGGEVIPLSNEKNGTLFTIENYEEHCNKYFKKNRSKLKKLMSEDVPEGFIERQLNDSRYISKFVKSLLSNVVRESGERETTSKNIVPITGAITSQMKNDWKLNDKWNEIIVPRFKRLNNKTKSEEFYYWDKKINAFRCEVPDELKVGFNKKRIDHRHHALDALIIACITKDHINYITSINTERTNFNLVSKLRKVKEEKITDPKTGKQKIIKVPKNYLLPWETFPTDARDKLQKTVVSFKQNLRVINKTNNKTWQWREHNGKQNKELVKQEKGNSWAIRKSMHKDTTRGAVSIRTRKKVSFSTGLQNWETLVDKTLQKKIKKLYAENKNEKEVAKYFKNSPYQIDDNNVKIVELYSFIEATAVRTELTKKFTPKQLESVTDSGIQQILKNHLKNYIDEKGEERFDLALSDDGIEEMNKNIKELNGGKPHQPIYKVRLYEEGNKFKVGYIGNNQSKHVESAKGTNLFFAIYWNEEKKQRKFETVPLNIVIEHQKQVAKLPKEERTQIPLNLKKGKFLFSLSPNDLVYIPTEEEQENSNDIDFNNLTKEQVIRIYKMVSTSQGQCHFMPCCNAQGITKNENGTNSKSERQQDFYDENTVFDSKDNPIMIKEVCWKLKTDRLGNITKVYK